ncbi:MAG: UDP-N-acetylmuramate--L-alanine ligase [Clostridia bacterium]|nr:UDP-N-acetylmuramate--L-alanine ligase [Clostridia bacterium]
MTNLKDKKIHFIGIGGVGVNALCKLAMDSGAEVSGSDAKLNNLCARLMERGVKICEGEDASMTSGADMVVYSSAIKQDNAELVFAREHNIPTLERQQFLREVSKDYSQVVGIAGTHGKTTTTAMLTHILALCGKNFVSMIGGESVDYGNYVNNSSGEIGDVFITEACEYKRNFLSLKPTVAVVTNVECDHPDSYENYDSVREAFDEYLIGAEVKIFAIDEVPTNAPVRGVNYGVNNLEDCDFAVVVSRGGSTRVYTAKIEEDFETHKICRLFYDGKFLLGIQLDEACDYNYKNATFAVATAEVLGINPVCAARALKTFGGVKRRFERAVDIDAVPVYFDFAHHPTEIRCVLERARGYGKVLKVFQPHTYTRTKAYFDDFVDVLGDDDGALVLMPTYAAREKFDASCEHDVLAAAIKDKYAKSDVYVAANGNETLEYVRKYAHKHDVILFIGAGDIYNLKDEI